MLLVLVALALLVLPVLLDGPGIVLACCLHRHDQRAVGMQQVEVEHHSLKLASHQRKRQQHLGQPLLRDLGVSHLPASCAWENHEAGLREPPRSLLSSDSSRERQRIV